MNGKGKKMIKVEVKVFLNAANYHRSQHQVRMKQIQISSVSHCPTREPVSGFKFRDFINISVASM